MYASINDVKRDLPTILVQLEDGRIVEGQSAGRKCNYPYVHFMDGDRPRSVQLCWTTCMRLANTGRPLRL